YLIKKYKQPLVLVICGGTANGEPGSEANIYLQELQNLVTDLNLEKHVIFRPSVPYNQVHEMYAAADIMIISAEHEPFGLTVLEAMACKKPVIATNNGGPASIITHNSTGILVNIFNPEAVANYVYSL